MLNRRLRRWLSSELPRLRSVIAASASRTQAERYRKHFDSFAHACMLLFHGLSASPSLRQSYAGFAACPGLVTLSGLARPSGGIGLSFSQLAHSNTTRPAAFLEGLVQDLISRVRHLPGTASIPPTLHLLDSSFLSLSLKLAPWLPGRDGIRLQLQYAPGLDLPEHVLVTDTRTNDCMGLDLTILDNPKRLADLKDHTLVIDLGYYSHRRFAHLLEAQVHLVSRLHPQAYLELQEDLPVQQHLPGMPQGRISVLTDQRVSLGSPNNRAGAVISGMRLVTAIVQPLPKAARRGAQPVTYRILTDRWDLMALEVIQLYLWRWQIELFLRWLKSHVHIGRLLGFSPNAVELTVWLALAVHLMALMATHALGLNRRSPGLLWQLTLALIQLSFDSSSVYESTALQPPLPGCELVPPI